MDAPKFTDKAAHKQPRRRARRSGDELMREGRIVVSVLLALAGLAGSVQWASAGGLSLSNMGNSVTSNVAEARDKLNSNVANAGATLNSPLDRAEQPVSGVMPTFQTGASQWVSRTALGRADTAASSAISSYTPGIIDDH